MVLEDGPTPEFVRWTLARPCALREEYAWTDPEQTERLLRPLRAVSDARREDRVRDGLVLAAESAQSESLEDVLGFVIEDALQSFGGEAAVAAACGDCPANVVANVAPGALAGCYGMLVLTERAAFEQVLPRALERSKAVDRAAFHPTQPPWYGLWLDSPGSEEQARTLHAVLSDVASEAPNAVEGLPLLLTALRVSWERRLPLYTRLIPAGRRCGPRWKLDPHCKRCKAPRLEGEARCRACGVKGEVCAGRTRKVLGQRPYYPLVRQIGASRLEEVLTSRSEGVARPI